MTSSRSGSRPYDEEYTDAVQEAARAIHASDVAHLATLEPADGLPHDGWTLPAEFDALDEADRLFYIRAAGAALTCVWERGWTRVA